MNTMDSNTDIQYSKTLQLIWRVCTRIEKIDQHLILEKQVGFEKDNNICLLNPTHYCGTVLGKHES